MKKTKDYNQKFSSKSKTNIKLDKKPYGKPKVIIYGKLKDITLAGSPGSGDTSNPGMELPPT